MSFDFIAQRLYDGKTIEKLNLLRHVFLNRVSATVANKEISAFSRAFDPITSDMLSKIMVNCFTGADDDESTFTAELAIALDEYLRVTYATIDEQKQKYHEMRQAVQEVSKNESSGTHGVKCDTIIQFLSSAIAERASRSSNSFDMHESGVMGL